jgi:nucleoid DNA-binding protein
MPPPPKTRAKAAKPKGPRPDTKAQTIAALADKTGLTRAQVTSVLDALFGAVMVTNLQLCSEYTIHGMVKVRVVNKPATPARPGRNPFTGEEIMIKAKPARKAIKVSALKALKDLV